MGKKAVLTVSFGTSVKETREKTIGAIEGRLVETYPARVLFRAWSSKFIIAKVAKEEGVTIDTPEQAMERISERGYDDVVVQPTHLADGYENRLMLDVMRKYADKIESLRVGRPLLYNADDRRNIADILTKRFKPGPGRLLVLMGHGSTRRPVAVNSQLEQEFRLMGCPEVFVGSVEGTPGFDHVKESLRAYMKARGVNKSAVKVIIAPLMIVSGRHVEEDLAGDEPTSWKSMLEAEGYEVETDLTGLGEYEEVQRMFAEHAASAQPIEAWEEE